jgi:F-type H+-transporting ATPase subunit delta
MRANVRSIADAFVEHAEHAKPADLKEAARGLIASLAKRGEMHRVRDLIRSLEGAWRRKHGMASIRVESAAPLSAAAKASIEKSANGASVETVVKPELIGGARIRIDDRIVDASVSGRLERLRRTLHE